MVDDLDALHRAARVGGVGAVAAHDLDVPVHRREVLAVPGVEVVEHAHAVPALHERLGKVRPDEPRPPRHQDVHMRNCIGTVRVE